LSGRTFGTTKKPELLSGSFATRSTLENSMSIPKFLFPACHQLWGHPNRSTRHVENEFHPHRLENVQPKDLVQLQRHSFKIKVFYGAHQTKIPLALAKELQRLGPDAAEYIDVQGTGRNALDFHIAYYIGRLSAESPDATFHIISKDTGFDPLIKHLRTQDITWHRLASLSAVPCPGSPAPASSTDLIQKVANTLLNRKDSRPRTRKTLATFIKAQLNKHATEEAVKRSSNY
jgi:PIN domain-containing protein